MNVSKPTDYSALFAALDTLVMVKLPQMELYLETGRLICGRLELVERIASAAHLKVVLGLEAKSGAVI